MADPVGGGEAQRQADAQLHEAGAENQPRNLRRLRAERQPEAELLGALRDGVGGDRVDADRGQDQREDGEDDEDRTEHRVWPPIAREKLVERANVEERLIRVERLRRLTNRADHRPRAAGGADDHCCAERRRHARRLVEHGRRLERLHLTLTDGRADADDRQPRARLIFSGPA